jgi:hypothetical protein
MCASQTPPSSLRHHDHKSREENKVCVESNVVKKWGKRLLVQFGSSERMSTAGIAKWCRSLVVIDSGRNRLVEDPTLQSAHSGWYSTYCAASTIRSICYTLTLVLERQTSIWKLPSPARSLTASTRLLGLRTYLVGRYWWYRSSLEGLLIFDLEEEPRKWTMGGTLWSWA